MVRQVQKIKRYYQDKLIDEMHFECTIDKIHTFYVPHKHKFFDLKGNSMPTQKQLNSLSQSINIDKSTNLFLTNLTINNVNHYCLCETILQLKQAIIALSKDNFPHEENALECDIKILSLLDLDYKTSVADHKTSITQLYINRKNFSLSVKNCNHIKVNEISMHGCHKIILKKNKNETVLKFLELEGKPSLLLRLGIIESSKNIQNTVPIKQKSFITSDELENMAWCKDPATKLKDLNITSKKEWRAWTIKNHPDTCLDGEGHPYFSHVFDAGKSVGY